MAGKFAVGQLGIANGYAYSSEFAGGLDSDDLPVGVAGGWKRPNVGPLWSARRTRRHKPKKDSEIVRTKGSTTSVIMKNVSWAVMDDSARMMGAERCAETARTKTTRHHTPKREMRVFRQWEALHCKQVPVAAAALMVPTV